MEAVFEIVGVLSLGVVSNLCVGLRTTCHWVSVAGLLARGVGLREVRRLTDGIQRKRRKDVFGRAAEWAQMPVLWTK